MDAQIYHRDALEPGFSAAGPAVIEEYGSTTVVWPGDRFEIGELHEIRDSVFRHLNSGCLRKSCNEIKLMLDRRLMPQCLAYHLRTK